MRSIRSAAEADWPSVWSIISQVAATGHSYFLETDISEAAAKEYWMGPGLSAYVADDDGEVVCTYTLKANHRAIALWQRLGFRVVGTVPKAFRHLEHGLVDLHIMHRFL